MPAPHDLRALRLLHPEELQNSSRGQLLEAKEDLQKMLADIPLTDDERAAVDDAQTALDPVA
ncbi:hypothetical protein [Streptomyces sp. NPDC086182]|uniref:hypothetical protein n=1 Tax=Streptomyces sp. NPDC086182 TaxID=3155058 RepID=UPI0034309303